MPPGIKFSVIGCGRIAQRHAEHIQQAGTLVAVCDVEKEKADKLAATYNAAAYYSVADMLRQPTDVVCVCTPNGLHASHTIAALEAGCHVLCEKPMALRTEDCRAMIRAAENAGKKLFIVKQNRFNPPVAAVKKLLDEGRLGVVYSIQVNCFWNRPLSYYKDAWRGTPELDGGPLFTQFSHFIDLIYWLFGEVADATALKANFGHGAVIGFEDTGVVLLRLASGAIGTINYTLNSYGRNMEGSLTIFGEKGTVKIGGEYLDKLEYQHIEDFTMEQPAAGKAANDYGGYKGSMSNHDKVYENVIAVLQNGQSIATGAADGLHTVTIIEKINKGSRMLN
ncbi:MAG TPA: Gfo/Idh/MocA family oxidoreductase [Chitinophagaceae bacterium]